MKGINKVCVIGHLGDAPKCNTMSNGDLVCNLSIATTRSWKDKSSGEKKEHTEWHRAVLYRRTAEFAKAYLQKGSKVYVEGRLQTRKWQSDAGENHYTTEIVVNDLQGLDSKQDSLSKPEPAPQAASAYEQAAKEQPGDFDDDIPF